MRRKVMGEILKYKPDEKPGYRIEMFKCSWCFGARYYSGKYGMTACEQCTKGYQYRYVKLRKTKGGHPMKTETEIKAKRIQRKRTKGFRLSDLSENVVYVGRPGKFGNPFRLTPDGWIECYSINRTILNPWILWSITGGFDINDIIELYELWANGLLVEKRFLPYPPPDEMIESLRGRDLACWCKLTDKCHADILLKLANE